MHADRDCVVRVGPTVTTFVYVFVIFCFVLFLLMRGTKDHYKRADDGPILNAGLAAL